MIIFAMVNLKKSHKKDRDFLWYYIKNIFWGVLFFIFMTYSWNSYDYKISTDHPLYIPIIINVFLFPFAKKAIESFALRFTSPESWSRGVWIDTPGKTGVMALFYLCCYVVAIPIGLPYAIYLFYLKKK